METNGLKKKDLLEAFDMVDYTTLNKWLKGDLPVHQLAMLRFCNYYNVPVTMFYVDGDAMPPSPLPDYTSQTEPTDGYGIGEGKAFSNLEVHATNRTITTSQQAIIVNEGLERQKEQRKKRDTALMKQNEGIAPLIHKEIAILQLKLDHIENLRRLEQEHLQIIDNLHREMKDERERFIEIIEEQRRDIAGLFEHTSGSV